MTGNRSVELLPSVWRNEQGEKMGGHGQGGPPQLSLHKPSQALKAD